MRRFSATLLALSMLAGCQGPAGTSTPAISAHTHDGAAAPRGAGVEWNRMIKQSPTILIVHGAWGGAWAFREVDAQLTADGYHVVRPTLTGQGEKEHLSTPNIDLSTHIQDIVNVIRYEDLHDIVLVGHSYGGMVITGVADRVPDRIRKRIYLDALLPENGESANSMLPSRIGSTQADGYIHMTWPITPDPPHDVLMPAKTFSESITLEHPAALAKIPAAYILTVDPGKTPESDTFYKFYLRAKGYGWPVSIMEGDHNVQWSRPAELVKLIEANAK